MLLERQIRGIIATCILLAFIPFFLFVHDHSSDSKGPEFSMSGNQTILVEIVTDSEKSGIYFLDASMTLKRFLQYIDLKANIDESINLKDGTSLQIVENGEETGTKWMRMSAEKRIAMGLPLDVNQISLEELLLIPGVGESTATMILARRKETGKFQKLEQLMEIKGIKEKKLQKLSQYLYVEKTQKR